MNFPLFIAKRIYSHKEEEKRVSRPAIAIATAGVAIGLAVMIISVCVVLGFQNEVKSKVMGFGSHIQVVNFNATNSMETYPVVVNKTTLKNFEDIEGVKHSQRFATKPGLLKTNDAFQGIVLKGVGPEYDMQFIKEHLVEGEIPEFSDEKSTNKALISKQIANDLGLKLGDKIYSYFIENSIRARRLTIVGIYQTNLAQYDKLYVYTDLHTVCRLNNWEKGQCSGAELLVEDLDKLEEVDDRVVAQYNRQVDVYGSTYAALTIKEICPQIFGWLSLLDMNVWVILILMVSVAAFTMISGLLIIILERTNMIGILKALGATNSSIRHIFLSFSAMLIGKAMIIGDLLGIGLVWAQHQFGIVHLNPESYYVDEVPVLFNPVLIIGINLATLVISMLVLIVPSYLISRIHPAKSIRFE